MQVDTVRIDTKCIIRKRDKQGFNMKPEQTQILKKRKMQQNTQIHCLSHLFPENLMMWDQSKLRSRPTLDFSGSAAA